MMQRRFLRRPRADDAGFSLVETIVALVVFALLMTAVASALLQSIGISRSNDRRVTAAHVAERQLEAVRAVPANQILTSRVLHGKPAPVQVGQTTYYVDQRVQYVSLAPTGSPRQSCGGLDVVRVSETVRWDGMAGVRPVTTDTVRPLGQAGADPAKGSIAVVVADTGGAADEGLAVLLTGPATALTAFTDSEGCAIFPQLSAANLAYTAELNSTGWVDPAGRQTSRALNISVTPSNVTRVSMVYTRAGTLRILPQTNARLPVSPAPPPVTVKNNAGARTVDLSSAGQYVTAAVPVPEGYQVWLGGCTDANPAVWGVSPGPAVVVGAGQIADAVATAPTVVVSGASAGTPVFAVHAADAGCPSGAILLLGRGAPARAALPYGRWTIANRPDLSRPPAGGWLNVDVTPRGADPLPVTGRFS